MENSGEPILTRCCIAGGGPAGMMLGLLLASAGIDLVPAAEATGRVVAEVGETGERRER